MRPGAWGWTLTAFSLTFVKEIHHPQPPFLNYIQMIHAKQIFPTVLIILDLGASAVCAAGGDWRRAVYWIAAAVLTTCVTY